MKVLKFQTIYFDSNENLRITSENYENHENHRIQLENNENH